MRAQVNWSPGPRVKVLGITLQDEGYWVVSAAAKPVGICQDCGTRSQHRHGWHHRRLRDLPVQGQSMKIKLALNRWQCRDRRCGRRTFTDRLPEIAAPYLRRTERMVEIVGFVGHRMGGRPGESQVRHYMRAVPNSTVLSEEIKAEIITLRAFFANAAMAGSKQD
ncbi:transposase family protein [Rhizobium changzhiense]|uniref:transposase family protein n=1 Tax=Rhizobium changzhiense TaxID=2692317 RepID=UPI003CCEBD05